MSGAGYLGRMSGDEIVASSHASGWLKGNILPAALHRIAETYSQGQWQGLSIWVRIGTARYPENGSRLDTIKNGALKAMYASKDPGKISIIMLLRSAWLQTSEINEYQIVSLVLVRLMRFKCCT